MALEQQDQTSVQSTQNRYFDENRSVQDQMISADDSLFVSYYYIRQMNTLQEIQQIRKALVPFADVLIEHVIDLETHHLILYHHQAIHEVTIALQYFGAELQQTLSHYEPIQMEEFPQKNIEQQLNSSHGETDHYFKRLYQKLWLVFVKFRQWIKEMTK